MKEEGKMKRYLIKRTLHLITTFLGAVVIIYFIFMAIPGDFVTRLEWDSDGSQETIEMISKKYHLDKTKTEQFGYWLKDVVHGNLGLFWELRYNAKPTPVAPAVKYAAISTLKMMFLTMLTSMLIAIPLTLKAASRAGGKRQKLIKSLSTIGISLPSFIIALLLVCLLARNRFVINYFFDKGRYEEYHQFVDFLKITVIPFIVLNLIYIANIVNYGYVFFAEIVKTEYIKYAHAMGFKERTILYKYTLKNALIPLITIIGTSFSMMFFEVSLIEAAIGRPGLGSLMVNSVSQRQYNVAMAIMLVATLITLIFNYVADLLCFAADPRVKI
jgi:peptide/nickel transport system permease protein